MQWQSSVWSQAADCIHKAYTHKLTHECVFKFAIPVTITAGKTRLGLQQNSVRSLALSLITGPRKPRLCTMPEIITICKLAVIALICISYMLVLSVFSSLSSLSAVLSVFSHTPVLRSRLGRAARLDCGFSVLPGWQDPGSGFAVEWRYQFRGEGRLVYAYNGQTDRLEERSAQQEEASMDLEALHRTGNASLLLHNVDVHHRGTYICTVYLPYILAQVAMELEVIVAVEACRGRRGALPPGGSALRTHPEPRRDLQGTYICTVYLPYILAQVAMELEVIGASGPSIEDAIGLFVVAFLLYGLLKLGSRLFCVKGMAHLH
ncbi:UNVERIFIED_CONTAM: hypothetical protein FKN15_057566 [Acipenser sinensis]